MRLWLTPRAPALTVGAPMRIGLLLVALAALLTAATWLVSTPAAAQRAIAGDGVPISLEVSAGELIQLDGDAASVFIANPEIADIEVVTPNLIYVFARAPGRTNIIAVNEADGVVGNILLISRLPVGEVNRSIASVVPGSTIRAEAAGGSVMLTGIAGSAIEVANAVRVAEAFVGDPSLVINQTSVDGPNQINLRVRIAEVSRTVTQELGVNWQALVQNGDWSFGALSGRALGAAITGGLAGVVGDATAAGSLGVTYDFGDGSAATGLLDLLDDEGLISVLAEPNLTTVSGETASFLAGGEFPIPLINPDGQATVEFRPVGVTLSFTPTLLAENRISMRVRPEVSSQVGTTVFNNTTLPELQIRRAETSVELGSGETLVIAGLFQSDVRQSISGLPGLMDLPVLGALFRSESFQNEETELLIFVTPYLVGPVGDQRLVAPNDPPGNLVETPDFAGPRRDVAAQAVPVGVAGSAAAAEPASGSFVAPGFILK